MCKENLNLSCLEKFMGHSVFIKNEGAEETFIYSNLLVDCSTYDNGLMLSDGNNDCKTFIPYETIYSINNINDDLYSDKISISAVHYNWKIGCAEKRPVLPKCFKCGKEIREFEDQTWYIQQEGMYGSKYDGEIVSVKICDDCLSNFLGDSCITELSSKNIGCSELSWK